MRTADLKIWAQRSAKKVDWNLLFFLLLFMNVKMIWKLVALVFIYIRQFDFSFRFSLQPGKGLSFFYPSMILIALANIFLQGLFHQQNYWIVLLTGTGFWILCLLAMHQVYLFVKNGSVEKIHTALFVFFMANAAISLGNLVKIMIETHEWNPYRYQGLYQKYFISTGDYIRGISFDTSTTNALLNGFGLVYFLLRSNFLPALICMIVLLLCCSNFTNLLIIACMVFMFLFRSSRSVKSMIVINLSLLVIFMTNISPANNDYSSSIFRKSILRTQVVVEKKMAGLPITQMPDSLLGVEERRIKTARLYLDSMALSRKQKMAEEHAQPVTTFKPEIPKANIHAPEYQHKKDTSEARLQALVFLHQLKTEADIQKDSLTAINPPPGKLVAYRQLFAFIKTHPSKWFMGNGLANFSSKLAFRATGLKIAGGYPAEHTYISKDFAENHLSVYLDYYARDSGFHSIVNAPNSTWSQLLGEYGLLGVSCFLIFYIAYFARSFRRLTYGLPVLLMMAGAFFVEYWFEQLSIVVLFELLLLLDLKTVRGEGQFA